MKRLLMILIVLAGCVAALGFYRGWFEVTTGGSGSQHGVTFTVDENKIKADEKKAREQLPTIGHSKSDRPTTPAEQK